jgi:hypothetical protein
MPDIKMRNGVQDSSRINITERYEVEYWTAKFGVSPEKLRNAVNKVGASARLVEEELRPGE